MKEGYFQQQKWPWLAVVFLTAPVALLLVYEYHWPRSVAFPAQWLFLLLVVWLRYRLVSMHGMSITFDGDYFPKWGVLLSSGARGMAALIYKIEKKEAESVVCWCWPFTISRWLVVNIAKVCLIRIGVLTQIIK